MNTRIKRRRVLRSLTAWPLGALLSRNLAAAESLQPPACILAPEMTEGPFFVEERLERSNLLGSNPGRGLADAYPLQLVMTLVNVRERCAPLRGIQVDVWHTDALGRYSDVEAQRGQTFCRGYQSTDASGRVAFSTVYPGWYPGRAIHIHVKARRFDAKGNRTSEYTTQLFFDEATNDAVMAMAPYSGRGMRRTTNARDGIYANARSLIVSTRERADGKGVSGTITLGLDIA